MSPATRARAMRARGTLWGMVAETFYVFALSSFCVALAALVYVLAG